MLRTIDRAGSWWELPYIFPEEQAAARLERFLNSKGLLSEKFSPKLVPYLREEEALKAFLVCLAQNHIEIKVYRLKDCISLRWEGETYCLTTEDKASFSEPLLWPAMDQFILRKCDAYDQNRPLPISSVLKEETQVFQNGGYDLDVEKITQVVSQTGIQKHDKILEQLLVIYEAFTE